MIKINSLKEAHKSKVQFVHHLEQLKNSSSICLHIMILQINIIYNQCII